MFARKATMGRLLISLLLRHDDHYFSSGGHLQSFQKSMNRSGAIWWLDYPCLGEAGCQPRGARWDNDGGGNESAPAPESSTAPSTSAAAAPAAWRSSPPCGPRHRSAGWSPAVHRRVDFIMIRYFVSLMCQPGVLCSTKFGGGGSVCVSAALVSRHSPRRWCSHPLRVPTWSSQLINPPSR